MKNLYANGVKTTYYINENGEIENSKGHLMKFYKINSGYFAIKLSINNKKKAYLVHRLVAENFIGDIPKGYVVNHIDGIKTHNSVTNLEIIKFKENVIDAINQGLTPVGEDTKHSIYSNKQIEKVCKLLIKAKYSLKEISKRTGVDRRAIQKIKLGHQWKSISKKYVFTAYEKYENEKFPVKLRNKIISMINDEESNKNIIKKLKLINNHNLSSYFHKLRKKLNRRFND